MVEPLVLGVLTYAHVLSAIGWLGATLTMNLALGPLVPRFTPATRNEVLRLFLPRFARMTAIFAGLTVVFGIGLYLVVSPGSSASWMMTIDVGILLALVAFVIGIVLMVPGSNRLSRMVSGEGGAPGAPLPAEFLPTLRRVQLGSVIGLALLVVVLAFMVASAQL